MSCLWAARESITTPTTPPKASFKSDIKDFTRKIRIRDVFWGKESNDESLHRNKSNRPVFTDNQEINNICKLTEILQPENINAADNLTQEERRALEDLVNNEDIVIKKADKGGNFVLMDKSFYRDQLVLEGHLKSNDYETLPVDADKQVMKNLKALVKKHKDCLTDKEQDFITNFDWKTSQLYVLPKIHKNKDIIEKITIK